MKVNHHKRANLKVLTTIVTGGVWASPVIKTVILPAHAQTSSFSPDCIVGPWESNDFPGGGPNQPNIDPTLDFKSDGRLLEDNSQQVGRWSSNGRNVNINNLRLSNSEFEYQMTGELSDNCNTLIGTYIIENIGETGSFRLDRL